MTKPYERQPQVLRLLLEHGPLSARGIRACLSPPPSPRSFFYILSRLHNRNLLSHRFDRVTGRVFHQITQNPQSLAVVAATLKTSQELLEQPHFRHAELLHSEDCAIWSEHLRRQFPEAVVWREHQFAALADVQELLLTRGEERDLLPDILLSLPTPSGSFRVTVAFEIERSAKSEKRLTRKLRKYAEQTRLDGLLYVCSSDSIEKKLLTIYKSKVATRALRIRHYADNFFLFADGEGDISRNEPQMFNAARQNVSLAAWMRTLGEAKDRRRLDYVF